MASRLELIRNPESSSESFIITSTQKLEQASAQNDLWNNEVQVSPEEDRARRNRFLRLAMFVVLELLWISFGLYVGLNDTKLKNRFLTFFGFTVPSEQISQSTLTFIAGLYQTFAFIFPGALIGEAFAGEWLHLLHDPQLISKDKASVDVVSLLTSGSVDRIKYFTDRKRSSSVFSVALVVSLLLVPLHSMMTSVVTMGPAFKQNSTSLTIGILPSISTFGGGQGEINQNARNLQLAARDAYISEVTDSFLDVVISPFSAQVLFGVPQADSVSFIDVFDYSADAVFYNYTCNWVAPQFVGFDSDVTDSQWTIDDSGVVLTIDPLSIDVGNEATFFSSLYGFWPLTNAEDFTPYNSGSLAWLLLGGNSTSPLSVVNMSPIPETSLTFNESGWFDLRPNNTEVNAYLSQLASVLVCDPGIRFGNGDFELQEGEVSVDFLRSKSQGGQIDQSGAEWMFGMGLDGIPFDTILTQLPLFNATDASGAQLTDMSQVVFELMMQLPSGPGLGATPQDIGNISSSLNSYIGAVGPNIFFDGTLGNTTVDAAFSRFEDSKQQFVNSWPYWLTSLLIIFVISILLTVMIVKEGNSVNTLTIRRVVAEVKKGSFD